MFEIAMESFDHILVFWLDITRLRLPHVLFVSTLVPIFIHMDLFTDDLMYSMRYSRMLEESSFANRRADYFWLLLISSIMLLVRCASS